MATLDDIDFQLRRLVDAVESLEQAVRISATDESYFVEIRDDVERIAQAVTRR